MTKRAPQSECPCSCPRLLQEKDWCPCRHSRWTARRSSCHLHRWRLFRVATSRLARAAPCPQRQMQLQERSDSDSAVPHKCLLLPQRLRQLQMLLPLCPCLCLCLRLRLHLPTPGLWARWISLCGEAHPHATQLRLASPSWPLPPSQLQSQSRCLACHPQVDQDPGHRGAAAPAAPGLLHLVAASCPFTLQQRVQAGTLRTGTPWQQSLALG